MCGIWLYLLKNSSTIVDYGHLYSSFMKIKARGPERSRFITLNDLGIFIGYHRLSIMDTSTNGDQPFILELPEQQRTIYVICNGELYNHKHLIHKYNIKPISGSDCEVLPHIYAQVGIDELCKELSSHEVSGEFSFCVIDIIKDNIIVHAVRDPVGVRPLFIAEDDYSIVFSSELKGVPYLKQKYSNVEQLKPGTILTITRTDTEININQHKYFNLDDYKPIISDIDNAQTIVRETLIHAVHERMHPERQMGFLLSGGVDSSLICAIGAKYAKKHGQIITTFSIGMPGSTDKEYALLAAEKIGSKHYHLELKESDFLAAVDKVIEISETYDITTIRATVGQYLASKWISEHTDIKVLYIGDGSDELFGGYRYFLKAPSENEYNNEIRRLLTDIHMFDVLRSDRGIASNGIEARVPFLDHRLIRNVLLIDPALRMPQSGVEKWLLRSAFSDTELLPESVLWRKKEAFSDGVSGEKSWYVVLQEHINKLYSDDDFKHKSSKYTHNKPPTKEALYYREKFTEIYGDHASTVIPYFWLPKWCGDVQEPSARVLSVYK